LKYFDYSKVAVQPEFSNTGRVEHTCDAALGTAFIAGSAEDGPGVGVEGVKCGAGRGDSTFSWLSSKLFCAIDMDPCQGVKIVAVPTGKFERPMTTEILPNQLMVIGSLAIVGVPSEITTMAGRRLRESMLLKLRPRGVTEVIIGGYSNDYAGYITTKEEYQAQNYEGGHTVFGEHTLGANIQNFNELAQSVVDNTQIVPGPDPIVDLLQNTTAKLETGKDAPWMWKAFGQVVKEPSENYSAGNHVKVEVVGSNPNNNLRHQSSYFEVMKKTPMGTWEVLVDDSDWSTRMHYVAGYFKKSTIIYEWVIPEVTGAGVYKFVFRGSANVNEGLRDYGGSSRQFVVR
jgi:neutral ceramidase